LDKLDQVIIADGLMLFLRSDYKSIQSVLESQSSSSFWDKYGCVVPNTIVDDVMSKASEIVQEATLMELGDRLEELKGFLGTNEWSRFIKAANKERLSQHISRVGLKDVIDRAFTWDIENNSHGAYDVDHPDYISWSSLNEEFNNYLDNNAEDN
jgi:hypothetical protein